VVESSADTAAADARRPRRAIVTGASSGIGAAIARALGGLGWTVGLGARRRDKLDGVAAEVEAAGGRPLVHLLDVTDSDSIAKFFDAFESAGGPADAVVSNAGLSIPGALHEQEPEDLRREVTTNLLGPMWVARRAIPPLVAAGRGDLVFIGSLNAVLPRPLQAGYTASKAGLEALVRTLQMELEGSGVRASLVRPGPTRTELGWDWDRHTIERVLTSWKEWGVLRHRSFLPAESVARAVVAVLCAPPGTHMDLVQVNPERR